MIVLPSDDALHRAALSVVGFEAPLERQRRSGLAWRSGLLSTYSDFDGVGPDWAWRHSSGPTGYSANPRGHLRLKDLPIMSETWDHVPGTADDVRAFPSSEFRLIANRLRQFFFQAEGMLQLKFGYFSSLISKLQEMIQGIHKYVSCSPLVCEYRLF